MAGIGPVLLERSGRAKRIIISVKPDRRVRVAVPAKASFKAALEFVELKKSWIIRHLELMRRKEIRRKRIREHAPVIDKAKATRVLSEKTKILADKYGFSYNRLTVRNQKTRWGSCSSKNNINLNMKLLLLPDDLIDYVIIHELAHTRVHNHSKQFWQELDSCVGDGKAMAKKLRQYGDGLLGV